MNNDRIGLVLFSLNIVIAVGGIMLLMSRAMP